MERKRLGEVLVRKGLIVSAVVILALVAAHWFLTGGMPGRKPAKWLTAESIAHKGLWADGAERPENSLAAFAAAADAGHPIELDTQLSADGHVVVFHDYELERMTGAVGKLSEKPLADLQKLRLGGGRESIPTLKQVFELVDGRVPLFVEVKNEGDVGKLEDAVARELTAYDGRVAVMSFNPNSLARVAKSAPEIQRGQLSGAFREDDLALYKKFVLSRLLMNWTSKPDFIAYEIAELPTAGTRIQKWRGRPLLGWTAETRAERERAAKYCDAVICDEAALR